MDPRVLAGMAVLGMAVGALFVFAAPPTPSPADGMFIVESTPDALLHEAVDRQPRFRVVEGDGSMFAAGEADLIVFPPDAIPVALGSPDAMCAATSQGDGQVLCHAAAQRSLRGEAAAEILDVAVRDWLDARLAGEEDQEAAFPLTITVAYEARIAPTAPPAPPESRPGSGGDDEGGGGDILDDVDPAGEPETDIRPDDVDPPFPIRSLLLTFAYVLPAGLLAQVQAANLHGERTRHRGILLLSAPVTASAILLGKSMPALALTIAIGAVVTVALGAGWLGFLASLAFLGFLYSASTFLAVVSRSPRELSLSQVAMTTMLNVFLFLPAMFPNIPPVAFLSPVHVVASGIRGDPVTLGQFLYATLPLSLSALALGALSIGMMREELLFAVRSSFGRVLDALAVITRRWWRVLLAGALVVPFAFAAEILVVVLTSVMGLRIAFLLFLPFSVLIEESVKGFVVWSRHRPGAGRRLPPWLLGTLVGAGFFVGEKSYLILTLVGFETIPFGAEVLALLGTGPGMLLLMLPLALHVATAMILAYGSACTPEDGTPGGATWRRLAFAGAIVIHFVYDQILLGAFA